MGVGCVGCVNGFCGLGVVIEVGNEVVRCV